MRQSKRTAAGFTLPELLVAAAVSMTIMLIIGIAFQKSIDLFRTLHAVAQMQDKLRSANNVLKRDLAAEHFGGTFQEGFSGPYVRDQRMDLLGWMPPLQGYFEIWSSAPTSPCGNVEAFDSDHLPSTIATDHSLRFTVKLSGKRQEDWFYAFAPGTFVLPPPIVAAGDPDFNPHHSTHPSLSGVASQWAEINYYLHPNGALLPNGSPLYALYRHQRLILQNPVKIPKGGSAGITPATYPDLSFSTVPPGLNTPATVSYSGNRIPLNTPLPAGPEHGDDILLTDVLSFEVHANWSTGLSVPAAALPLLAAPITKGKHNRAANSNAINFDWPFAPVPAGADKQYHFDTGSRLNASPLVNWNDPTSFLNPASGAPMNRLRLNSLQIRIRVWDFNTQMARQMTLIQDI